jgi:hypothetical protein
MRRLLLSSILLFSRLVTFSQVGQLVTFTIKANVGGTAKPTEITIITTRGTLKNYMNREHLIFDNCNYALESTDDIIKDAKSIASSPAGGGGSNDGENIKVSDPGEFVELYKREKAANHVTGEICVNSDGEVSFTIGTDNAKIGISTKGTISLSAKSPDGLTHTAEF